MLDGGPTRSLRPAMVAGAVVALLALLLGLVLVVLILKQRGTEKIEERVGEQAPVSSFILDHDGHTSWSLRSSETLQCVFSTSRRLEGEAMAGCMLACVGEGRGEPEEATPPMRNHMPFLRSGTMVNLGW